MAHQIAERLLAGKSAKGRAALLAPRLPSLEPLPERIPAGNDKTAAGLARRQQFLREQGFRIESLAEGAAPGAPIGVCVILGKITAQPTSCI